MVLKIGPDRPVRPAIGHYSGLVRRIGPGSDSRRSGQRLGGSIGEPDEPSVQFFFSFLLASARPIPVIFGHQSVVPVAALSPKRSKAPSPATLSSRQQQHPPKVKNLKQRETFGGSVVLRLCHFPTALKVEEFSEMGAKKLYRGGRRTKLSQLSGLGLGF